jgi:hypothetical protein
MAASASPGKNGARECTVVSLQDQAALMLLRKDST